MKSQFLVIISLLAIDCLLISCDNSETSAGAPRRFTKEHFRVPSPVGIYEPKNLKKMDMLEMIVAKEKPSFKFDMIIRDFNGNIISADSVNRTRVPIFIQLYQNDSGRVVEAVEFPITKDFQKAIIEWK